jgi:subtilisin family serine protease
MRTMFRTPGVKLSPTVLAFIFGCFLLAPCARAATEYVEGEVIVTFKAAATLETAKAALKTKSLSFAKHFGPLSAKRKSQTGLIREKSKTTAQLIATLKDDPNVETVEPNYLRRVNAAPNDSRFTEQWALNNTGQTVNGITGTASDDVKFVKARALSRTPLGEIVIGVIDTGVDIVHPDLAANVWKNTGETPLNNTDDDGNGFADDYNGYDFADGDADPSDSGDHGTHVAGTIAAIGDNLMGVIGVSDKVSILPLKVSTDGDSISTSAEISAFQYATALKNRGVNIVALNASFGGGGNSTSEKAAIQAAGDAGIIVCVAAGNDSANNDTTATYPASYRLPNMIVVAATDQNDALASYSNYGATTVDIAAPGSNILSTKPATVSFQVGGTTYESTALTYSGLTTGLSGAIIDCGTGNSSSEFPASVNGNIALIQRGIENFTTKVTNAMAAGAKAAIIYNNVSGSFAGTLQTASNWIPAYSISQADGQAVKAGLPKTGALVVAGNYQYLDGTSMATPHVTGAVGFAAMNFPGDTVAQRRARVLSSVNIKTALQTKVATHGRLNLLRIVDANVDGVPDWELSIVTTTLPEAIGGEAYSRTLAVTGGSPPYTWSIASGSLPEGFALNSAGVVSGTSSVAGSYAFTAKVTDSFGATATQDYALAITVNTMPTIAHDFVAPTINEDAATAALAFTVSDEETAAGSLSVTATSSNPALIPNANILLGGSGTNRTVTCTSAHNLSGTATITVTVSDGQLSAGDSFLLTVNAVNDAPVFTKGANQTANSTAAGVQTVAGWATNISPGPGDEADQLLDFTIASNTNSALFAVPPAVAADGTLTYTPASNADGTASIEVQLHDDGGVANGGIDTSAAQTFTITVAPSPPAETVVLAVKGEPVPGAGEDSLIPAESGWGTFGVPSITMNGAQAGWLATVLPPTPGAAFHAIFAGPLAAPTLQLKTGQSVTNAEGAAIAGVSFKAFRTPVFAGEDFAVTATMRGRAVTTANDTGIWVYSAGTLRQVAREGRTAPGAADANFVAFTSLAMPSPDSVFFTGTLTAPTGTRNGLWVWTSTGGTRLALRTGEPIDLGAGPKKLTSFKALIPVTRSFGHGRYDSDVSAIDVQLRLGDGTKAIGLVAADGSLSVTRVSGIADALGRVALDFGIPSSPGMGEGAVARTIFKSNAASGITTANNVAIIDGDGETILAQKGMPAPSSGTAIFKTFFDPVAGLGPGGTRVTAFVASLARASRARDTGIWAHIAGTGLSLVAREADPAPDTASAKWSSITSLAVLKGRGPIFTARLQHVAQIVTSANDYGLWAVDSTGNLRLILRTGGEVAGETLKDFTVLGAVAGSPGQSRAGAVSGANASIIYRATFIGGGSAIINTPVP